MIEFIHRHPRRYVPKFDETRIVTCSTFIGQAAAFARVQRVIMPNLRYRQNIGSTFLNHNRQALITWEYLTDSA